MKSGLAIAIGAAALGSGCVIGNNTESSPVQFEAGEPSPIGFLPGVIIHEVCIAVDVDDGFVRPVALVATGDDSIGPVTGAVVQPLPVAGLACPSVDLGYQGWARIEWRTELGRAVATFEHTTSPLPVTSGDQLGGEPELDEPDAGVEFAPAPSAASAGEVVLDGERFSGYDVTSDVPDVSDSGIVTLPIDVWYRAAGILMGRPADDVELALSYVPYDLTVFGTSTGGDGITTDFEGHVDILYRADQLDCFASEEFAVFVTPPNGGTTLAASLPCTPFK